MREFFRGWRRRLGCAALVFTLALTIVGFRSYMVWDRFLISRVPTFYVLNSIHGGLHWGWYRLHPLYSNHFRFPPIRWNTHKFEEPDPLRSVTSEGDSYLTYAGFSYHRLANYDGESWCVPYRFIVLLSTLVSGYLILWKPRKRET